MSGKTVLYIAVGLLVLAIGAGAAVVYRHMQLIGHPFGRGMEVASADGKYVARASTMHEESFWGQRRTYYDLQVTVKLTGETVFTSEVPEPNAPMQFDGSDGRITWSADSKTVTFGSATRVLSTTTLP